MNQKVTKSDFQSQFFMPRIIQIFYFVAIIFGKLNLRNSLFLMEKSILKIFGSVDEKSPLNSVLKLLTGKGPPINYVVSKLAIFDPLFPSYLSFYHVELAIFDPHPLSLCDAIVYGWPLNVKIQY